MISLKIDINELKGKNQSHFIFHETLESIEDLEFKLLEPVKVDFSLEFIDKEVYLKGNFETKVETTCVKCLNPYEMKVQGELESTYLDPNSYSDYANSQEDDVESDMVPYEVIKDGKIDLDELVREHIILEINPYGICSEECSGLEEFDQYADDGIDPRWMDLLDMSKKMNK